MIVVTRINEKAYYKIRMYVNDEKAYYKIRMYVNAFGIRIKLYMNVRKQFIIK